MSFDPDSAIHRAKARSSNMHATRLALSYARDLLGRKRHGLVRMTPMERVQLEFHLTLQFRHNRLQITESLRPMPIDSAVEEIGSSPKAWNLAWDDLPQSALEHLVMAYTTVRMNKQGPQLTRTAEDWIRLIERDMVCHGHFEREERAAELLYTQARPDGLLSKSAMQLLDHSDIPKMLWKRPMMGYTPYARDDAFARLEYV